MTTECDVVIVGGGPAGSTAGYLLSSFGFKTVLLEKQAFPRKKLCGGLLTHKTLKLLSRVFGETDETLIEKHIIDSSSQEYEIVYGKRSYGVHKASSTFHFVERLVYDNFLLEKARASNVDVREGDPATEFDFDKRTVTTKTGQTFRYRYLIGADGATSQTRSRLLAAGLLQGYEWTEGLASALELYVPRSEAPPIYHPIIYFGFVKWGYTWIFPNQEKLILGVGALNAHNRDFDERLLEFTESIGIDGSKYPLMGHPVPYGNFVKTPSVHDVILIGDAAGSAEPVAAEGIFYGQRTGELAAWAIRRAEEQGKEVALVYNDLFSRQVLPELEAEIRRRKIIFKGPKFFAKIMVQLALWYSPEKISEFLHGDRSYRTLHWLEGLHEATD